MAQKKLVVVFGATGNQGGSVIKSIQGDPRTAQEFKIRGITRDTSKPNAKALEGKGVETVAADINNKDQIKAALQGAYAVFAVTNYWEKMDAQLEEQQGKDIADLSKEAGVQHLIWSSLLNVNHLTNGKFPNVEHFDSKAAVEQYIRDIGVPATFFMPGFFMSNFEGFIRKSPDNDNAYILALPMPDDTPIPMFDAGDDTGKFVKGILTHREKVLGKRVLAATDYETPEQIMETFKECFPKGGGNAAFVKVSKDEYKGALAGAGMPEKAQQELYENMAFMHDYGYYGKASLDESHSILDEKPTTFKDFLSKSKAFAELK
ncbi:MAG: hypothetical protein L6R37_006035 [Teloschistes peruensis]|nr:MAG: hypothetical protein L6R37_006035 [Teloschistes peruensis]